MHKLYILSSLLSIFVHAQAIDSNMSPFARINLSYKELKNDFYDINHLIQEIEKTGKQIQMGRAKTELKFDPKLLTQKMEIWKSFKEHVAAASEDLKRMQSVKDKIRAEKKSKANTR